MLQTHSVSGTRAKLDKDVEEITMLKDILSLCNVKAQNKKDPYY